jgi:hypothetical protein
MDINYHQLSRIYIYIKKQNFDKNNRAFVLLIGNVGVFTLLK